MVPYLLLQESFYHQKELNMIKNLTKEQKHILLEEGTEPAGTSPLNYEKRDGDYCCAGCGTKLFESEKKYESGSGWPSFLNRCPMYLKQKLIL